MFEMIENAIEAHNLTKRFGNLVAVDDISFTIRKGEIFGLVGPNGAGKSTTIKMLTGLTRPTYGVIHIREYNLRQKKGQVLKIIGVLPEDVELYQDVTGRDMLNYFAQLCDIPRDIAKKRVSELLTQMGLYERADSKIGEYSTGMRQKLAVAQALINNPEIVFLDEPTKTLDPHARHQIRQLIRDLKERQVTVLVTSHLLDEMSAICDRMAIMGGGKILASDTPAALGRATDGRVVIKIAVNRLNRQTLSSVRGLGDVDDITCEGNIIFVHLGRECEDVSAVKQSILKELLRQDLQIEHFGEERAPLEDVFLKLTEEDAK
jgi:ABC-2 type transport system ATP-binding protein